MKLTYFNVHGRAQPLRLMFSLTGTEYEEVLVDLGGAMEEWASLSQSFPLGKLPILETDDGEIFPQTVAISSYLASTYGLNGVTKRDGMVSSVIAESCNDLLTQCGKHLHFYLFYKFLPFPGEDVIAENKVDVTTQWKKICTIAEKYQQAKYAGKPFINGDRVTEPDIWLWSVADYIRQSLPDLECNDWYKSLEKNFLEDEGVKKYLANRIEISF